jgi:agmatine deiminase
VVLVEAINDEDSEPPLWREHDMALLENACDAERRELKILRVLAPRKRYWKGKSDYAALCYLNAYVANGVVVGARFGDVERDEAARTALAKAFPERETVMLPIDHLAAAGGGVHCLTQSMPASKELGDNRTFADNQE